MPSYSIAQWALLTNLADVAALRAAILANPRDTSAHHGFGEDHLMSRVTDLILELASTCLAEGLAEEVAMLDRANGGHLLIDCAEFRSAGGDAGRGCTAYFGGSNR